MKIEIPDDIVYRAEASALELRVALAVQLYSDNRIDHRDACRLAGVSETVFRDAVGPIAAARGVDSRGILSQRPNCQTHSQ